MYNIFIKQKHYSSTLGHSFYLLEFTDNIGLKKLKIIVMVGNIFYLKFVQNSSDLNDCLFSK